MTVPTATSFVNPSPFHDPGSGWRGRPLVSTFTGEESLIFLGAYRCQVADPLIEAVPALLATLAEFIEKLCPPPGQTAQGGEHRVTAADAVALLHGLQALNFKVSLLCDALEAVKTRAQNVHASRREALSTGAGG